MRNRQLRRAGRRGHPATAGGPGGRAGRAGRRRPRRPTSTRPGRRSRSLRTRPSEPRPGRHARRPVAGPPAGWRCGSSDRLPARCPAAGSTSARRTSAWSRSCWPVGLLATCVVRHPVGRRARRCDVAPPTCRRVERLPGRGRGTVRRAVGSSRPARPVRGAGAVDAPARLVVDVVGQGAPARHRGAARRSAGRRRDQGGRWRAARRRPERGSTWRGCSPTASRSRRPCRAALAPAPPPSAVLGRGHGRADSPGQPQHRGPDGAGDACRASGR